MSLLPCQLTQTGIFGCLLRRRESGTASGNGTRQAAKEQGKKAKEQCCLFVLLSCARSGQPRATRQQLLFLAWPPLPLLGSHAGVWTEAHPVALAFSMFSAASSAPSPSTSHVTAGLAARRAIGILCVTEHRPVEPRPRTGSSAATHLL